MPHDFWDDRNAHLQHLPDHVLFDVARNDAADRAYRRHAVEILVTRKSPRVKHPDLADLVAELEIELDGIQFEYPAPSGPGPMIASITTETLWADGPMEPDTSSDLSTRELGKQFEKLFSPDPEKEDDVRKNDSGLRSEARTDNAEQGRLLPGEQKPTARRNRNRTSAPTSKTV